MVEPQNEITILPEIDAEKGLSIDDVIAYLDNKLPIFSSFFKAKYPATTESEPIISQVLCTFLNTHRNQDEVSLLNFEREWKESIYAVDFAVIDVKEFKQSSKKTQPFFSIEAKRLPTPGKNRKGESREREYVQGSGGGIQRYKKGNHGKGLTQSSIIGYVQDKDCNHWFIEINNWIKDLINTNTETDISWEKSDLLKEKSDFGKTRKYHSQNKRIVDSETDSIELHHYLIELN